MVDIYVSVRGQNLYLSDGIRKIVDGTSNFINFVFDFDNSWDGLSTACKFVQGEMDVQILLDDNNSVRLPSEIKDGMFELSLFGADDNSIATSDVLTMKMLNGNIYTDDKSITPSLFIQLLSRISDLKNRLNNLVASETIDEELIDARAGNNGKMYPTAGEAIRQQLAELNKYIDDTNVNIDSIINLKDSVILKSELTFEEGGISTKDGSLVKNHDWIRTSSTSVIPANTCIRIANPNVDLLYIHEYTGNSWNRNLVTLQGDKTYMFAEDTQVRMVFTFVDPSLKSLNDANQYFCLERMGSPLLDLIDSVKNTIYNELMLDLSCTYTNGLYNTPGFISSISGEINPYGLDKAVCTDFVSIDMAKSINGVGSISNAGCIVAFYNEKYEYLKDISIIPSESSAVQRIFNIDLTEEKYKDAKYVRVSMYRPYTGAYLNVLYGSRLQGALRKSVLTGKVINAVGDSITSTDYSRPCWWEMIAADTGCIVNDYGWSGTTLAHTDERHLWGAHFEKFDANELGYDKNNPSTWAGGGCFCERVDRLDSSADGVIVMGGTNDNNVSRGSWDSTDTSTFFGALNVLITGLLVKFAGKPILFCTPIKRKSDCSTDVYNPTEMLMELSDSDRMTIQLRAEAVRLKCRQYGIPCLDLYNGSGINGVDTGNVYYRNGDDLHPSDIGQTRLKTLIQSKLETLFK